MNRGYLVVFEGGEGSGKSTQINLLADYLKKNGKEVFVSREPGGTLLGETIRNEILLNPLMKNLNREAEAFLFYACRAQLLAEEINPGLERGEVILLDRYYYSTIVYQGMAREVNLGLINEINKHLPKPDIAFILDVEDVKGALEEAVRSSGKADRFEEEKLAFHTKVRDGFRQLTLLFPEAKLIKRAPVNDMQAEIREYIDMLLKLKKENKK